MLDTLEFITKSKKKGLKPFNGSFETNTRFYGINLENLGGYKL